MNNIERVLARTHSQSSNARYITSKSGKSHTITYPGQKGYQARPARGK